MSANSSQWSARSKSTLLSRFLNVPVSVMSWSSEGYSTVYSILISQPTANITLLKQLFCTSTITSSVLLSCKMWNRPVFLAHFLLRCPPRLCPWFTTLHHIHHSSQYPHFLLFSKQSPLRRWHSAFSFLPSDSLRLQQRSPSRCSRPNLFLDDYKSSNSELLRDWISAHRSQ